MIADAVYYELAGREYNNFSQRPDLELLRILAFLSDKYGKLYCFPSQEKICAIRGRGIGRVMSRRTLNRHLNTLERYGLIKRQRRHTRHAARGWCFKSTMYTLTRRALRWLKDASPAAKRAAHWWATFVGSSRVPNSAQHYPPRDNYTGSAPKGGAPPGPEQQSVARSARDDGKETDPTPTGPGYLSFKALCESMRRSGKP